MSKYSPAMLFGVLSHRLQIIFLLITLSLQINAVITCTSVFVGAGYPTCGASCASICLNYCADLSTNPGCLCTTPAYLKDASDCVMAKCDAADYATTSEISVAGCKLIGYNIADQVPAYGSSATTTSAASNGGVSVTAASATSNKKGGKGLSIGAIVGIAVGALALIIIACAVGICLCIRKRKSRGHGPVTTGVTEKEEATEEKNDPAVTAIQQAESDAYPTVVTESAPPPQYPTAQGEGLQQQQIKMQMQPVLVQQGQHFIPIQQHLIPLQQQQTGPIYLQPMPLQQQAAGQHALPLQQQPALQMQSQFILTQQQQQQPQFNTFPSPSQSPPPTFIPQPSVPTSVSPYSVSEASQSQTLSPRQQHAEV